MEYPLQYISDANGKVSSVIIPIEFWERINCEDETEYLLKSENNRERLTEALNRSETVSKKDAYERFGV